MGYQLIPTNTELEDEHPPLTHLSKEDHVKEAAKIYKSFEPLSSDQVARLRENFGWNEFSSQSPHALWKLLEAVSVTLTD